MSRALRLVLALVVALAAVVGLLLFVQSRDRSTLGDDQGNGAPGRQLPDQGAEHRRAPAGFRYASAPPASGPHLPLAVRREAPLSRDQALHALELGDVVLFYGDPADESALRAVQEDTAGPFDPDLAAAGQAVLVEHRPHTNGVIALAWRRMLNARSGSDPAVRAFTDHWLGKGADQ